MVWYRLKQRARSWTSGPKSRPGSPVSSPAAAHRGSSRSNGVLHVNALTGPRRLVFAPLIIIGPLAACDDSTGPPPVSTVEVTGAGAVPLKVGDSVQLDATVRDADGNELTDREVTWSSSDDSVGTVSLTGLVKAIAAGEVTITALSEGMEGTAVVSVSAEVGLTSISPATLRAGETATLTGEGFSSTLAENIVRVGGERAIVTEATPIELKIQVSQTACQVTGDVDVQVAVDPGADQQESNVLRHPFEAEGESFSLGVGELERIEATPDFCLRFSETNEGEAYLIGLQSTATSVATVTPATVSAAAAVDGATLVQGDVPDVAGYRASAGAGLRQPAAPTAGVSMAALTADRRRGARWERHRRTEDRKSVV